MPTREISQSWFLKFVQIVISNQISHSHTFQLNSVQKDGRRLTSDDVFTLLLIWLYMITTLCWQPWNTRWSCFQLWRMSSFWVSKEHAASSLSPPEHRLQGDAYWRYVSCLSSGSIGHIAMLGGVHSQGSLGQHVKCVCRSAVHLLGIFLGQRFPNFYMLCPP
jgi:hypothetical protein